MKLTSPDSLIPGIWVLLALNFFDAVMTLYWVYVHAALETNPAMATTLDAGPLVFIISKAALVFLGAYILHKRRDWSLAKLGIIATCSLYAGVAGLHLGTLIYWVCPYFHIYSL